MRDNRGRIVAGSLIFSMLLHGAVLFLVKVENAPADQKEPERITVSLKHFQPEPVAVPVVAEPVPPKPQAEPVVKKNPPKKIKKPLPVREKPAAVKAVEETVPVAEEVPVVSEAPAEVKVAAVHTLVPAPRPVMPPQPEFDYDSFRARLTDGMVRNKKYPYSARRRGYEGTVVIKLHIDCEGRLQGLKMVESSGFDILDNEALSLASSVFPIREKLPEPVTLLIPINYSLHN